MKISPNGTHVSFPAAPEKGATYKDEGRHRQRESRTEDRACDQSLLTVCAKHGKTLRELSTTRHDVIAWICQKEHAGNQQPYAKI